MPGAKAQYQESGNGKFGVKYTKRGGGKFIKWFPIKDARDREFTRLENSNNILIVSTIER